MAQPAVVTNPLLVMGFDLWGDQVTAMMARGTATRSLAVSNDGEFDTHPLADDMLADGFPTSQLAVLAMSWWRPDDPRQARVAAVRATLEAHGVVHLTVERDGLSVWVGPTVLPRHGGCDRCWRARRHQHAEFLSAEPGSSPDDPAALAAFDVESVPLAAKAAAAVGRRILLGSPEVEAGVVRRLGLRGVGPSIGRVVAVSGCPRCDRPVPTRPGWSLGPRATTDIASPTQERR